MVGRIPVAGETQFHLRSLLPRLTTRSDLPSGEHRLTTILHTSQAYTLPLRGQGVWLHTPKMVRQGEAVGSSTTRR
jgi:hypothetical protein